MSPGEPLLVARNLCAAYGQVPALTDVDFDIRAGEVHALVGENGAGKSTLSRLFAGQQPPTAGTLSLRGKPYAPRNGRDAARQGVRMVMQELNLIGTLTVAESLFIDALPHRGGWIDRARLRSAAAQALARVGLQDLDPDQPVGSLGVGRQQLVEIAAGLAQHGDLLILDEPTAALTDPEIDRLFEQIAALKASGTGVLYISHRLDEIRRIADRISILRDGRMVGTHAMNSLSMDEIIRGMVGRDIESTGETGCHQPGAPALRVRHLRQTPAVRDVSFDLHHGEILGFAGLMGSGRTETMRAIFGADVPDGGEIYLGSSDTPVRFRSPMHAVRRGIALLTENRKEEGLLLPLSIRANITLAGLGRLAGRAGWIHRGDEHGQSRHWVDRLRLHCRSPEQPAAELSGGNQQKVVLARWLFRDCDILFVDEPTRGIDVGARQEIHRVLRELADAGKAVAVVSSDLVELMALVDRMVVLSAGRDAATFARGEWTEDAILSAALSGYTGEPS